MGLAFTQGDNAVLNLTATDGNGNPINITGASFSTQMLGPNGSAIATFANGKHSITNAALGQFSLTLGVTDTQSCGVGNNKDIVTAITLSGNVTYFRASGILTVWPPVPLA